MCLRLFITICLYLLTLSSSVADDIVPSTHLIETNRSAIIKDDELLTKALIILRLDGFYDEALALGIDAARYQSLSRRNRYELALIYVAKDRCDLARPYFHHLSAHRNDWLAEDSKRFLRQCKDWPNLTWSFDISAGYDQNLALSNAQQTITAEAGSQIYDFIKQIEANLSGISISPDFEVGDPQVSGWYSEMYANLGFIIPRSKNRYRTNLTLYQRLATPRGYDRRGIGISGIWQHRTKWVLYESEILMKRLVNQKGDVSPSEIRHQVNARQALTLPLTDISYVRVTGFGTSETYPREFDKSLQDQGIAFGFNYQNPQMMGGNRNKAWWRSWYVELSKVKRITTPNHQKSDRLGISGLINLVDPETSNKLLVQLNMNKESLALPRPWRLHPHHLWHISGKLVFEPGWVDKNTLKIELGWENTQSKDVLDRRHKWNFILRYQLDNTKR